MSKRLSKIVFSTLSILYPFSLCFAHDNTGSAEPITWQAAVDSTDYYKENQECITALKWAKLAVQLVEKKFGKQDTNYVKALGAIPEIFYYMGQPDSAVSYGCLHLNLCRVVYPKDHPELANTVNNVSMFYDAIGDYTAAEPLHIEALAIYRRLHKEDHPDLASCINNLAAFYYITGDYVKTEPLYLEALAMYRRLYKTDNTDLAMSINNIAGFYQVTGDYQKAEPLFSEALAMYRRLYQTDHPDLAAIINNHATFFKSLGDYQKAEPLYSEALAMYRRLYQTDHPDLAAIINNVALLYRATGDYQKAEPLLLEALAMYRRIFKGDHPDLAMSLDNLAAFYNITGDYHNAEHLLIEALTMYRHIYKTDNPDLALCINNLANFYHFIHDYRQAELYLTEAMEMFRRIYKTGHPQLAMSISNLASFYVDINEYGKAEPLLVEALEMYRGLFEADHPELAGSIMNMACFYRNTGDYPKAEKLLSEALAMRRRVFKTPHPDLANNIGEMAAFLDASGNYRQAEPLYIESMKMYSKIVSNYFPTLSESEKENFWNIYKNNFERFNSHAIKGMAVNPAILCLMYDNQLATKALLYNSASKIRKRIMNSADSSLAADYNELMSIKERLVKFYSMTSSELEKRRINIDSVENTANKLSKKVSLKSEEYKQSYERKNVDWKTVQSVLKPDEAAVEIVRFRLYEKGRWTDTIYYAALIVSDQTPDNPDIVLMENGNKIESQYYQAYRNSIKLKVNNKDNFKNFWEKIYEKTKQYKKLYFSPDGVYNKLNVLTLEMPDGGYLLDKQEIQTLNSSKDLLFTFYSRQEESNVYNSAVLVGNPNFGLSEDKLIKESRRIRNENKPDKTAGPERGMYLASLPGTEKEIRIIEKYLKGRNWAVKSYLGNNAVVSSVKMVNNPRVLHIATHGMFLGDVQNKGGNFLGIEEKRLVENPLLRSGLFFTGAENYFNTDSNRTNSEENGLLTAYEAMNLELDRTELVVLSACETGLGEIKNGEGVFGLRRAFQQAGAKSVLMSLWKVDDNATQQLMTTFYSKWLSGKTKREAFREAQLEIKSRYPQPYYWGAFVMVGE